MVVCASIFALMVASNFVRVAAALDVAFSSLPSRPRMILWSLTSNAMASMFTPVTFVKAIKTRRALKETRRSMMSLDLMAHGHAGGFYSGGNLALEQWLAIPDDCRRDLDL